MSETEIIDAEIVEEEAVAPAVDAPAPEVQAPTPGVQVAVRPPGTEVLMPMDTEQVVAGMKAYQQLMQDLLEPSDWQGTGDRKFPKKSAWRKIGRAFNLSLTKVSLTVERDAAGNPLRAEAVFRAMAPNGQVQDGDGYCSADESRFQKANGRQKLENDLRATATTRAKNRAISDLVGMGEVSAEEVEQAAGPPMPIATEQQANVLNSALKWLLPPEAAEATWRAITSQCDGSIYGPVANAVIATIKARKDAEGAEVNQAFGGGGEQQTPPSDGGLITAERVSQITGGFGVLRLSIKEIGDVFAAAGLSRPEGGGAAGAVSALKALTVEQADKLEAQMEKVAQDAEATAPDASPNGGGANG